MYLCKTQFDSEITTKIYCGVEQLVARRAHNPKVIGSSPVPATRKSQSKFDWLFAFLEALKVYFQKRIWNAKIKSAKRFGFS